MKPIEILLLGLAAVALLEGCASADRQEICIERFMGRTDQGDGVVAHVCMSPEAFAEAQK